MAVPTPATPVFAEHWDLIWQVVLVMCAFLGIVGTAVWFFGKFILTRVWLNIDLTHKKIDMLTEKIESYLKLHYECQRDLPLQYVDRVRFNEFVQDWHNYTEKRDRQWDEMWGVFNNHSHSGDGRVVRGKK